MEPSSATAAWSETESVGFAVRDLVRKDATAPLITAGDRVSFHYTGRLRGTPDPSGAGPETPGRVFDDSREATKPIKVNIGASPREIIAGLDNAMQTLKLGDTATVFIAASAAYGAHGHPPKEGETEGGIPPNADICFDIEVVAVNGMKAARSAGLAAATPDALKEAGNSFLEGLTIGSSNQGAGKKGKKGKGGKKK